MNKFSLKINSRFRTGRLWLVCPALAVLLVIALVWILSTDVKVYSVGKGVVMYKTNLIHEAVAQGDGLLKKLLVATNKPVKKGQVIAVLDVELEKEKLGKAETYLKIVKSKFEHMSELLNAEDKELDAYYAYYDKSVIYEKEEADKYFSYMAKYTNNNEHLMKIGAISVYTFMTVYHTLIEMHLKIFDLNLEKKMKKIEMVTRLYSKKQEHMRLELDMLNAENNLAKQKIRIDEIEYVRSPIDGIITQLYASVGKYLSKSELVATIAEKTDEYEVLGFFPPNTGKRIQSSMSVLVSPTTVAYDRYGLIIGKILNISDFTTEKDVVNNILYNAELSDLFTKDKPVVIANIELFKDSKTPTGFLWSNREGPPYNVTPGSTFQRKQRSFTSPRTGKTRRSLNPWNGLPPCAPMSRTKASKWCVTMASTATWRGASAKRTSRTS